VESLAASGRAVGVKTGPGIPHDSVPAGCEAQWVSVGGDVTEVTLWFNAVSRPGIRRAALLLGVAISVMMMVMGVIREHSRQPYLINGEITLHQQITNTAPSVPSLQQSQP